MHNKNTCQLVYASLKSVSEALGFEMASTFTTIYNFLSLGNLLLLLLLLFILHYLTVLYEFRNMPPGPRLTTLPVLGNILSLDLKAKKFTDAFQRSVNILNI